MRKKTIILSVAALALMLSACGGSSNKSEQSDKINTNQTFNLDTTKLKNGEPFYQCSMDKEVLSDKPGNCPKCGMELRGINKQ